jgi:hypothetical protein
MRHLVISETLKQAYNPGLEKLIAGAGGHQWTPAIDAHMKAEAKKLRPNLWYYVAKSLPFKNVDLGCRLEAAIFFTLKASFALVVISFIAAVCLTFFGAVSASGIFFYLTYISITACGLVFLATSTKHQFSVIGPGYWKTETFDRETERYATAEVLERVERLRIMLPEARFEISLLYQGKWLFDPVLWLIIPVDDGTEMRKAVLVWDDKGNIVLPY